MILRLNKILDFFIYLFSLLIVFLVPLFFPYFFITNNLFELTKFILFKILVLLWILVFFVKLVIDNNFRNQKLQILKKIYFRNKLEIIIFSLFVLSLILSSILALYKNLSVYGLYDRQFGLVFYFYCLLFFGLFVLSVKSNYVYLYVKAILVSSFFVCFYALAQISGYDFMNWSEKWGTLRRATSTLGQPNFLASYLLLVIPITIYFIYTSKKLLLKFFSLIVFIFQLLTLYLTYSRGGWLGLVLGFLVFGVIYLSLRAQYLCTRAGRGGSENSAVIASFWVFAKQKYKNVAITRTTDICGSLSNRRLSSSGSPRSLALARDDNSCVIARSENEQSEFERRGNPENNECLLYNMHCSLRLVFVILIIFVLIIFSLYNSQTFSHRLTSLLDFQSGSVAVRMSFWRASWDAIRQKPLFGYGLDNQGEVLIKYYQKDWGIFNNVNSCPNRVHNLFLDILLTRGIFGLFAYLALLYLFFSTIFKNIKENKARELSLAISAATICYLVSLQFSFSFITSEIYFWLYFAIAYLSGIRKISY